MTIDAMLDGVLEREGGWRDETPRPHAPPDPATNHGITLPTLRTYRQQYLGTPAIETTLDDLRALTTDEAKQIYAVRYVQEPGFTAENIPYEPLRVQLIDFGINSGPERAIRWLQRVLKLVWVGVDVNGRLDFNTLAALDHSNQYLPIVNDALVAARSYMIDQATDQGLMRKADEEGVESRALSFLLAKPTK